MEKETGRPVVLFFDLPDEVVVRGLLADLEGRIDGHWMRSTSPDAWAAAGQEALVCVSRAHPLTAADIASMPRLRLISAWGVGYNHVDLAAATARRIPVCINPVFARSMAEAALVFILSLSKNLLRHVSDARTGARSSTAGRGVEIRNRTLGLVGFGRIGRELGDLAHRLEMRVIACDPYLPADAWPSWVQARPLDGLLRDADFVVIAAPLAPETRHLIGAPQLAVMKPSAYLINIARGSLVDEGALLAALREGRIAGAGIDVWEEEPVSPENPLLADDGVIGTPHRLGATVESLHALCASLKENILRALDGRQPLNVVNPEIFDRGVG